MSDLDLPSTPTPSPSLSIWQRSPLVRCLRWPFSPRNARRLLIVAAAAALLVALFYAEEDWRGQRAWTRYRRQLEARGEQLDWSGLLPQPVPDEQNFAGTPLVRSWFPRSSPRDLSSRWGKEYSRAREFLRVPADQGYRHWVDLVGWEAALAATQAGQTVREKGKIDAGPTDREARAKAARGLLLWALSSEAEMNELREASQRPY